MDPLRFLFHCLVLLCLHFLIETLQTVLYLYRFLFLRDFVNHKTDERVLLLPLSHWSDNVNV